jgi:hypothetical protein
MDHRFIEYPHKGSSDLAEFRIGVGAVLADRQAVRVGGYFAVRAGNSLLQLPVHEELPH